MKFTIETENVSHAKALLAYLGALQGEATELLRTTPGAPAPEVKKEKVSKAPKETKAEAPAPLEIKDAEVVKETPKADVVANGSKAPWDEEPEVKEVKKEITLDDLRQCLKFYSDKYSVEKALEVVKDFGGTRLSDIKPEKYAALVAKLTA